MLNSSIDPEICPESWTYVSSREKSMRYHEKDKQTQTELGWSCGENDRKPLDDPYYVLDAPGGKKGTEENQGQMEGRLG